MTDTTLVTCSCYWYDGQYCEECEDDFFSLPCLCDPESNYVCPPCYEAGVRFDRRVDTSGADDIPW